MSHGARITIVYSVSLGVALVLLFAGCISTDNWLPMLGLVPVLFVPVLVVICNYITPFQTQSWEDIGERDRCVGRARVPARARWGKGRGR